MLDIEKLKEIKRTAIIALFSDDDLMDSLVLKGGNALDIVYGIAQRASLDLDFSIDKEFDKSELSRIDAKIARVLPIQEIDSIILVLNEIAGHSG